MPLESVLGGNDMSSEALKQVPVTIKGGWSDTRHADWRGTAHAPEPIVAVVFLTDGQEIHWSKSERAGHEDAEVRLALFWGDRAGVEVQASFSVNGGQRSSNTLLPFFGWRPELQERASCTTGQLSPFARIEGDPSLDFHTLFILASQVKVVRNGLWRIKPEVEAQLQEPLRGILTRRRTGRWRAA
jgi:hypothetical protein